jgi:hypothetical protein
MFPNLYIFCREKLLEKILVNSDYLGWAVDILSPRFALEPSKRDCVTDEYFF